MAEKILKSSRVRTSSQQQATLVNYMCCNPLFASKHSERQSRQEWKNLAKTLNSLGHTKSILQWLKVWNDLKRNTKRATLTTPPGQRIQLTELEDKILDLFHRELFRDCPDKVVITKKATGDKYIEMTAKEEGDQLCWDWDEDSSENKNSIKSTKVEKKRRNGSGIDKRCRRQTRVRGSEAQLSYLLQFMRQHRDMAQHPVFRNQHRAEWSALTRRLNVLGPKKSTEQWKKAWRGQRHRAIRVFDEYGHDPGLLRLNAKAVSLQVLDILELNEKTSATFERPPRVELAAVETVKCETELPDDCKQDAALHSSKLDLRPEKLFVPECGGEDTPVVSWDWDPVGSAPPTVRPPSTDDDDGPPLRRLTKQDSSCKCDTSSITAILEQISKAQNTLIASVEKQAALLQKLFEDSVRNEEHRREEQQRSLALEERSVALLERIASLGESALYRPPQPPHRYHNHAS